MQLWKPSPAATSRLASGERKYRLAQMKPDLDSVKCPFCRRDVYHHRIKDRFYTLGGSDHHCKLMKASRAPSP
jgi:hypothetical protein